MYEREGEFCPDLFQVTLQMVIIVLFLLNLGFYSLGNIWQKWENS
jgi:hypothetical protein